jgi:hypothetical protein
MKKAMEKPLLLIAGIPATGKSHFGRWVANQHGYVHVDVEEPGRLEALHLVLTWNACFDAGAVSGLLDSLRALGPRVVLDWGFPPEWLQVVRKMRDGGMDIWWFDGDRGRAREEFINRATVSLPNFDEQMEKIRACWEDIRDLFRTNRIDVIGPSGQRMPPEEIWQRITTPPDAG